MIKKFPKKILLPLLITAIILIGISLIFSSRPQQLSVPSDKLKVVASFYPLYYFAAEIGGDKAEVINLTTAGIEPHDFEPTAQDIIKIQKSRLLILNGMGLESWGKNIKDIIDPKKTSIILASFGIIDGGVCSINIAKYYPLPLTNQQLNNLCQNQMDPHIWIAPFMAENIVKNILDGFVKIDPANAEYYQANAESLKNKLTALDSQYQTGLSNCQIKTFITSHNAFGYLAQIYDLKQIAIAGLTPDAEPSPAQLADIVKQAKADNTKYIFFESLDSPKLAQTVAAEIGAQTLPLNPLEGLTSEEIAQGKNYFTVEQNNLTNLQTALACQK
jgi:zinc transport system substrate-binding protein